LIRGHYLMASIQKGEADGTGPIREAQLQWHGADHGKLNYNTLLVS